jgi:hypothetical protein
MSGMDRIERRLNDNELPALAQINHELSELCHWLNERRDIATAAAKLIPVEDSLTHLVIEIREKQPRIRP